MFDIAMTNNYGDIFSEPGVEALARCGVDTIPIKTEDMIPLPSGSSIMMLPGRKPVGRIIKKGGKSKKRTAFEEIEGEKVFAVAATPPPGYTRTLLPAFEREKGAATLPFYSYSVLGWKGEDLYIGALKTHEDIRWEPSMYNSLELPKKIKLKKKKHPGNRLLNHLENCAVNYQCFTAQNIFYERWEGGIPVSAGCNARCVGCISEDRLKTVPSPQKRIEFIPTVQEITEVALSHLDNEGAIVSFGQGCEGEPLTRADLIIEAVQEIRSKTDRGTIHINTNGSLTEKLSQLIKSGLDSVRISLNSAIEGRYNKYFQPVGYTFEDVVKSIDTALNLGAFVSLNFLYLPGVNDREEEAEAFFEFLEHHRVNMIQFRNLNIDPDYYFEIMESPGGKSLGTVELIKAIKQRYPKIKIGNFSIPLR